ncbi:MAG: hypothetical protein KDD61_13185 [Bdellovibrionales bacterium]|nr:hypothetical protein [Bdellovibrionales bacterium]
MRLLLAISLLSALSTTAYASKARLTALGQDTNGSLYIQDNRNIFLNPARINKLKNHLNFEMGSTTAGTTPNAEGGVVTDFKSSKLGVQFGRLGHAGENIAVANNLVAGNNLIVPQNTFEIIYGTNSGGRDLGFSLLYGNSKSDTGKAANLPDNTASEITLRAGTTLTSGLEIFGYFDVQQKSKHENTTPATSFEYTGSGANLGLGATKRVMNDRFIASGFVTLKQGDIETNSTKTTVDTKTVQVQLTEEIKKTDKVLLFATAGVKYETGKVDFTGPTDFDLSTFSLPFVIGVEAKATSWMDLRASVAQTVLLDNQKTYNGTNEITTENKNSTVVAAGLSLKWEDFTLDGVLTGSTTGVINSTSLISQASLTYSF